MTTKAKRHKRAQRPSFKPFWTKDDAVREMAKIHALDTECAMGERVAAIILSMTVDQLIGAGAGLSDGALREASDLLTKAQHALEARKQLIAHAEVRMLECALASGKHGP